MKWLLMVGVVVWNEDFEKGNFDVLRKWWGIGNWDKLMGIGASVILCILGNRFWWKVLSEEFCFVFMEFYIL